MPGRPPRAYAVNDLVEETSQTYVCIVAHTSGVFATDRAAGNRQRVDGDNGSLNGNNTWAGTNNFDGAVDFDGPVDLGTGAATWAPASGTVNLTAAAVTVATAPAGDSDTSPASTAFVQAAVGKVHVQKFTSVPTTVTLTIASPSVLSWTGHGLAIGQAFRLTTSGNLPTGVAVSTTYFVISAGYGANSFQFSATRGGAPVKWVVVWHPFTSRESSFSAVVGSNALLLGLRDGALWPRR